MTRRRPRERPPLDEVAKAIIEQLQQDGRRSYAAIGKEVGLSEAAVRQRVQRLTDSGIMQVVAARRQYGRRWISAMPTNLYGPGDNFDLEKSHVLPALLRRFSEAARSGQDQVTLWGSGTPRREFLHSDDLGRAVVRLLKVYDEPDTINVGVGEDVSIRELAEVIADVVGFEGTIVQDPSKPDGTPRKLLDVSRITALGWAPQVSLRDGLETTYRWFSENVVRGF